MFLITLVLELLFFVGPLTNMWQTAETQISEGNRVRKLISHLTTLSNLMQDLAMAMLKTIIAPDNRSTQQIHVSVLQQIPEQIQALKEYVRGEEELAPVIELQNKVNSAFPLFEKAKDTYEQHDNDRHKKYLLDLADVSNSATNQVNVILNYYRKKEEDGLNEQAASQATMKSLLFTGIVLNVIWGFAIAIWFIKAIGSRLNTLQDNTVRFAMRKPLNRPVGGSDEITTVDRAFHEMVEALNEAQHKERAVIENAMDVICSIDSDGKFVEVSPACYFLWGYNQDELIGLRILEITESGSQGKENSKIDELTGGKNKTTFENRIRRKDGTVVDILWSAQWSNREKSWFCVAHDISERKQAEQMKREFVAMISHDLRTPLTSVELSLDLVCRGAFGALTDKATQRVEDARHNLTYVMTLINGLLDIEKMNAGKLEMRFSKIYIQDVIDRAIEAVEPIAQRDGFKLSVKEVDLELIADQDRLLQVMVNLVSNALKFSPKGGEVKVSTTDFGNALEVSVCDSGPGIPADQQERIFQRFERIEKPGKKSVEGTGLGLAISKAIVEQHGGSIGVQSTEGHGSTFYFRIPKEQKLKEQKVRRG